MNVGVYAGTFDPITKGHKDIIKRAASFTDKLIVAVLNNNAKNTWFTLEERKEMVKEVLKDIPNVEIMGFNGLLVDFMKKHDARVIIRGLRAVSDYEYELSLAFGNLDISQGNCETIFIPASKEYLYLSSSVVREVAYYDGDISKFIDKALIKKVKKRAREKREG
jgi:pantetheine-phosphate adenylyltransferase